jgi:hypothetical protein
MPSAESARSDHALGTRYRSGVRVWHSPTSTRGSARVLDVCGSFSQARSFEGFSCCSGRHPLDPIAAIEAGPRKTPIYAILRIHTGRNGWILGPTAVEFLEFTGPRQSPGSRTGPEQNLRKRPSASDLDPYGYGRMVRVEPRKGAASRPYGRSASPLPFGQSGSLAEDSHGVPGPHLNHVL